MSQRTSTRKKVPSSRLIEAQSLPLALPASSSSFTAEGSSGRGSKRRKVGGDEDDQGTPPAGKSGGRPSKKPAEKLESKETEQPKRSRKSKGKQEDEDPNPYCFCRQKDDGRGMIGCDECEEWYHLDCIGLTKAQAEATHVYICNQCEINSGGVKKSVASFDISMLASPPGSTAPKPSKAKGKKPRGAAANGSAKSKGKAAARGKKPVDADIHMDGQTSSSSSSSSSSDSEDSGDSAGSGDDRYGGGHQEDDSDSGASSSRKHPRNTRARPSLPDSTAHPQKRPYSSSRNEPAKKLRRTSEGGKTTETAPAELNKMRRYCINSLKVKLGGWWATYHELKGKGAETEEAAEVAHKADVDMDPATNGSEQHSMKKDVEQFEGLALKYAKEVELALWANFKEPSKEPSAKDPRELIAGQKYKGQFRLIIQALEKDLRPDLLEGIVTGAIEPAQLAVMTSTDLMTEELRQQNQRLQEEAMKKTIRADDPRPMRYTQKNLEDAEALQKIHQAIGVEDRPTEEETKPSVPLHNLEGRGADDERRPSVVPSDHDDLPFGTPQSNGGAFPSQSPRINGGSAALPSVVYPPQQPARQTSFSLSTVLKPSEMTRDLLGDFSYDEGIEAELPGFADVGMAEVAEDDEGGYGNAEVAGQVDSSGAALLKHEHEPKLPDFSEEEKFMRQPPVWSGKIYNPAEPDAPPPPVEARQVGGPDLTKFPWAWSVLLPQNPIYLVGRVSVKESVKYLSASNLHVGKELVILAFTPKPVDDSETAKLQATRLFEALFDFHYTRQRHAVSTPYSGKPPVGGSKELYIVPCRPGESFEFVDLMDRYFLPENRSKNVLLGVFIIAKTRDQSLAELYAPPATELPTPTTGPSIAPNIAALLAGLDPNVLKQLAPGPAPNPAPAPIPTGRPLIAQGYPDTRVDRPAVPLVQPAPPGLATFPGLTYPAVPMPAGPSNRPGPPVHPSRAGLVGVGAGEPSRGAGYGGHQRTNSRDAYPGGAGAGYGGYGYQANRNGR